MATKNGFISKLLLQKVKHWIKQKMWNKYTPCTKKWVCEVVGLEKTISRKMTQDANPPRGVGMWVLVTPPILFKFFYNFYDEDGLFLSLINLDLRAYNGGLRNYIKVGVHRLVLRPPWCSWSLQKFPFMRSPAKNQWANNVINDGKDNAKIKIKKLKNFVVRIFFWNFCM